MSQTVISCDRGRVSIADGVVRISKLSDSIRDRTANDKRLYGDLDGETREIRVPPLDDEELLAIFYNDFMKAERGEGRLTCSGRDGRNIVELANAMTLSSVRGTSIKLPLSRGHYSEFITEKVAR